MARAPLDDAILAKKEGTSIQNEVPESMDIYSTSDECLEILKPETQEATNSFDEIEFSNTESLVDFDNMYNSFVSEMEITECNISSSALDCDLYGICDNNVSMKAKYSKFYLTMYFDSTSSLCSSREEESAGIYVTAESLGDANISSNKKSVSSTQKTTTVTNYIEDVNDDYVEDVNDDYAELPEPGTLPSGQYSDNKSTLDTKILCGLDSKTNPFFVDDNGDPAETGDVSEVIDCIESKTPTKALTDSQKDIAKQIKDLENEESRKKVELEKQHNFQRNNLRKKCDAEIMQLHFNYQLEINTIEKEYKARLDKADALHKIELRNALSELTRKKNSEDEKMLNDHKLFLRKLNNEFKQILNGTHKIKLETQRKDLEQNFNELVQDMKLEHNLAVTSLHQKMIQNLQKERENIEMELLIQKHTTKRNEEKSRASLEENNAEKIHLMTLEQVKEDYNLKREFAYKRFQCEYALLNAEIVWESTSLSIAHAQERITRPRRIRKLYKDRIDLKKESLRICSNMTEEERITELRTFERCESKKMEAELNNLNNQLNKQLMERNASYDAKRSQLDLDHTNKYRVITDQKITMEQYLQKAHELRSKQMMQNNEIRLQVLEKDQQKEIEEKKNVAEIYGWNIHLSGKSVFYVNLNSPSYSSTSTTTNTSTNAHL